MAKPAIPVEKKTKHKTQELDLRPLITQLGREVGAESLTGFITAGAASSTRMSGGRAALSWSRTRVKG